MHFSCYLCMHKNDRILLPHDMNLDIAAILSPSRKSMAPCLVVDVSCIPLFYVKMLSMTAIGIPIRLRSLFTFVSVYDRWFYYGTSSFRSQGFRKKSGAVGNRNDCWSAALWLAKSWLTEGVFVAAWMTLNLAWTIEHLTVRRRLRCQWEHSTGPFAPPFARSPTPLTRSLAPHCSLRLRAPLRSLARSLIHFGAHGKDVFVYELNASISYSFSPLCIYLPIP